MSANPKRPQQNANGQAKQPSANPNGQARPPMPGMAPSTAPHAALRSNLAGTNPMMPGAPQPGAPVSQDATGSDPGGNLGMLQTRVMFKDLPPIDQAQVAQQMGVDPFRMLEIGQQQVGQAAQQGYAGNPQQGQAPNSLSGPGIDPSAQLDNFPHDLAALQQQMVQGYSPGADPMEHMQAQNAHAVARAMDIHAQQQAQNTNAHAAIDQVIAALLEKKRSLATQNPQAPLGSPQFTSNAMMGGSTSGGGPAVVNGVG